jgi:hypothetical protein
MRRSAPKLGWITPLLLGAGWIAALLLGAPSARAAPAVSTAPGVADSTAAGVADSTAPAPPDTALHFARPFSDMVAAARADTAAARTGTEAARTSAAPDTSGFVIRVDAARKRGETSLADLLRGRRPVFVAAAPSFASGSGVPILLDAGGAVRPRPETIAGERATDRTVISSLPTLAGAPGLATAWDLPESRGFDSFDFVAIDSMLSPGPFRSAGELLARPRTVPFTAFAMPDPPRPERVRSALYYRRGDGGLLDTGARFSSPLLARGVAASFTRHTAEVLPPFLTTLSTRYTAAAGLTRPGAFSSWVEGRLFTMNMEIDFPGGYANSFALTHARSEWASREAALHAQWKGSVLRASGALRVGQGQATQVGYQKSRERWRFPELSGEGWVSGGGGAGGSGLGGWTWSVGGEAARRRIDYREDSATSFRPQIYSGRLTAGLRRGGDSGAAADVAADMREGDGTLIDARLSLWAAAPRRRVRLDLESAHERPTYVDLLTPRREDTYFSTADFTKTIVIQRSGNPALRARALRGALAAGSLSLGRVDLLAFGSLRHVTDDFGWSARRSETADTVLIVDVAEQRGDGWTAFGAAGAEASLGPIALRGMAWARGGRDGLSPQSGSPPRVGLDASVGLRGTFFQGDLPLQLDLETHASGPRQGLIQAPAIATWDARLRADFVGAGVFLGVANLFDRSVPSAIYEIEADRGAAMPGRAFLAGVVWYLFD